MSSIAFFRSVSSPQIQRISLCRFSSSPPTRFRPHRREFSAASSSSSPFDLQSSAFSSFCAPTSFAGDIFSLRSVEISLAFSDVPSGVPSDACFFSLFFMHVSSPWRRRSCCFLLSSVYSLFFLVPAGHPSAAAVSIPASSPLASAASSPATASMFPPFLLRPQPPIAVSFFLVLLPFEYLQSLLFLDCHLRCVPPPHTPTLSFFHLLSSSCCSSHLLFRQLGLLLLTTSLPPSLPRSLLRLPLFLLRSRRPLLILPGTFDFFEEPAPPFAGNNKSKAHARPCENRWYWRKQKAMWAT